MIEPCIEAMAHARMVWTDAKKSTGTYAMATPKRATKAMSKDFRARYAERVNAMGHKNDDQDLRTRRLRSRERARKGK